MEHEYLAFKCPVCRKITIVVTSEAHDTLTSNHYIGCAHCGFKDLQDSDPYDDINECMHERHYIKINGKIKQIGK